MSAPAAPPPAYQRLLPGDRFPRLRPPCAGRPQYALESLAGRYQLYCFFLDLELAGSAEAIDAVRRRPDLFDDRHCCFFGVGVRPRDRKDPVVRDRLPGLRFIWDFDLAVSKACGAAPVDAVSGRATPAQRRWILVDPSLHIAQVFPFETPVADILRVVSELPTPDQFGGLLRPAPVLVLPNVFERSFCDRLIELYREAGGEESGVHRAGEGVLDPTFKRRKDHRLADPEVIEQARWRIGRRVLPEVERLFFMRASYIERHTVGCYAAEDGGHFSPHTDNSQGLTAHRRFAVSVNLNDDFEGGEVVFPEYNMHGYKAPAGWAVVFPCAALHAVRRVTRGARYAYLPFIYDEAGRAIRNAEYERARTKADAGGGEDQDGPSSSERSL